MNANDFRRVALSFPEAAEAAHMGHPDFRVSGKIFATLGYPAEGWGVIKLTPEQQDVFIDDDAGAFVPVKGAWGRRGATQVHLKTATKASVRKALTAAWRNTAPRRLARQVEAERAR
jgi:hypothetical protein